MYKFTPPKKNKFVYISVNVAILIAFLTLRIVCGNDEVILGLNMGIFCLFNGIWSLNKKNFSLIHRDDKRYQYGWIFALILGFLMIITSLAILLVQ